jgi:hypothetical protein
MEDRENTETPAKSAGPHTPLTSPLRTGQESGGQYQWKNASATPSKK